MCTSLRTFCSSYLLAVVSDRLKFASSIFRRWCWRKSSDIKCILGNEKIDDEDHVIIRHKDGTFKAVDLKNNDEVVSEAATSG